MKCPLILQPLHISLPLYHFPVLSGLSRRGVPPSIPSKSLCSYDAKHPLQLLQNLQCPFAPRTFLHCLPAFCVLPISTEVCPSPITLKHFLNPAHLQTYSSLHHEASGQSAFTSCLLASLNLSPGLNKTFTNVTSHLCAVKSKRHCSVLTFCYFSAAFDTNTSFLLPDVLFSDFQNATFSLFFSFLTFILLWGSLFPYLPLKN